MIRKVLSIVGARPQFMKLAPLLKRMVGRFEHILVHTGQHYDDGMSGVFFREFHLPDPDYQLGVGSGFHGWQTGQMLERIEGVLLKERPDMVVVYGDANSTLAGALAATKLPLPVAHVEAGLRSFKMSMPEEMNRVLIDHCSTILLCPTKTSVENLAREGITQGVALVGDLMEELLTRYAGEVLRGSSSGEMLARHGVSPKEYLLVTVHRAENTDNHARFSGIMKGLSAIKKPVLFPVHPRTAAALKGVLKSDHVRCLEPVGHLEMLVLESHAAMILTDSGGVQKEAYLLGVPCLTLRDETEWVETVQNGWNRLVGTDPDRIISAVREFSPSGSRPPLFPPGSPSRNIGDEIHRWLEAKAPIS